MAEAERLADYYKLCESSRILDIGCGVARLLTGILEKGYKYASYTGFDVDKQALDWCGANLRSVKNGFVHMDIYNERFNKKGSVQMDDSFELPLNAASYDIIYSWAVFTHLRLNDIQIYLKEFKRLLHPSGRVFLTAHLEEGVPPETENPDHYPPRYGTNDCGPLHRMRISREAFLDAVESADLKVTKYNHNAAWNHQTVVRLTHRA
jgi:SAM-dependent methyltransferase